VNDVVGALMLGVILGWAGGFGLSQILAAEEIRKARELRTLLIQQAEQIVKEKDWTRWP
jgi:hypothetical protein